MSKDCFPGPEPEPLEPLKPVEPVEPVEPVLEEERPGAAEACRWRAMTAWGSSIATNMCLHSAAVEPSPILAATAPQSCPPNSATAAKNLSALEAEARPACAAAQVLDEHSVSLTSTKSLLPTPRRAIWVGNKLFLVF